MNMTLTRRNLLKQLGLGVAVSSVLPSPNAGAALVDEAPRVAKPAQHGRIHLDRNENPYGASRQAIAALQDSGSQANFYPETSTLQNTLAAHHRVKPEQILLACGSSDALRMAATAFLIGGKKLILATPTCDLIAGFGKNIGAEIVEVPLRKDHAHDLKTMLDHASGTGPGGLLYVCNPNSPTGTLTTRPDLEDFLAKVPVNFHVVIDEAYHEYAGGSGAYVSFLQRPSGDQRVIVTRTFSVAYGLAGARIGYAVASVPAAMKMSRVSLPFPVNRPGTLAALAGLDDRQHLERSVKRNFDDRQEFMNQVNARMLRALDSHTNFVCLNVMRPAGEIFEHYSKNNFALAPLISQMPTYLRVSLGSSDQMMEFWRVWDLLGSHPMSM